MESSNTQKAGNNSNQNQFTNCNFVIGTTEDRVREIIKEEAKNIVASCSFVAQDMARKRTEIFEEHLLPKLVKDELFESFKRPEIMIALREAEKQAMCTDDEESYELLAKLLANRIKYSNDRLIASSLKNATEVAIEVADESLSGLTVTFMIVKYLPNFALIRQGIEALNNMFGIIELGNLTDNKVWIEQLDVLDLVRMNSAGSMKKIIDYYSERLNGYVCVGIKKYSDNYKKAVDILSKVHLTKDVLITHELNEEYVRLPLVNQKNVNSICVNNVTGGYSNIQFSDEQKQAIEIIINLYEKNDVIFNSNKNNFIEMWNKHPNLVKLREWWDKIEVSFNITMVGKVLAYTNLNNVNLSIELPMIELKDLIK